MKTLEEKARDFYASISENKTISEAMADFARQEVHKALDEAAEKAEIKVENDTGWSYTTGSDRFSNVTVSVDDISILSLKEKY